MTDTEATAIVKAELGDDYQVVRLGGYWVIGDASRNTDNAFGRVSPNPLRRSLPKAIADVKATQ